MTWILLIAGISAIGFALSFLKWRSTKKQMAVFKKAGDLDFVCDPRSTVVNNCSEVDTATEWHIICCVYCLFELEKNPARLDALRMSDGARAFLRAALAPIRPQEPSGP